MGNKEIREKIFKRLEEYDFEVMNVRVMNGYYLFDFGDESVVHFKIKGCKRWLFGLWIGRTKDGNPNSIDLFGEHEDYIDKFKPTRVEISEKAEIVKDSDESEINNVIDDLIWRFIDSHLDIIHSSNTVGKLKYYYGRGDGNLIMWLLSEWWFYRVKNRFRLWLRNRGNFYISKVVVFFLNLWYKRKVSVKCYDSECWYPRYVIKLNYKDGTNDDDIYSIWKHLNLPFGFEKSITVQHIPFGEKRPIAFKKKDK